MKLPEPMVEWCQCKDRPASECPGEWEPGCDLGNNEAHAMPVNQCDGCRAGQPMRGALHIDDDGKPLMVCQKSKYEAENEASKRNLCQLTDDLAESRREVAQLQEQNTYLDKVASELQDTCDKQAKKLAQQEAAMRQAIELLGPTAPECCGCAAEWNEAIKVLEDALK